MLQSACAQRLARPDRPLDSDGERAGDPPGRHGSPPRPTPRRARRGTTRRRGSLKPSPRAPESRSLRRARERRTPRRLDREGKLLVRDVTEHPDSGPFRHAPSQPAPPSDQELELGAHLPEKRECLEQPLEVLAGSSVAAVKRYGAPRFASAHQVEASVDAGGATTSRSRGTPSVSATSRAVNFEFATIKSQWRAACRYLGHARPSSSDPPTRDDGSAGDRGSSWHAARRAGAGTSSRRSERRPAHP